MELIDPFMVLYQFWGMCIISRQTIVAFSFNAFPFNAAQSKMKEFAALGVMCSFKSRPLFRKIFCRTGKYTGGKKRMSFF